MDCERSDGDDKKLRIMLTNGQQKWFSAMPPPPLHPRIEPSHRFEVVSEYLSERTIICPELKEVKLVDTDLLFAKGNRQVKKACSINSRAI